MKKLLPVFLFMLLPLFYSCISRDQPNFTPAIPTISATNNGQPWRAELTDTEVNDSMILHAQWKHDLLRMKIPVSASSNITLTDNTGQYYNTDDLGKVVQNFKLDKNYSNTVNIVVNTAARSVTGQFNLRFVIDTLAINPDTTGIDTVTLAHGTFVAPLK